MKFINMLNIIRTNTLFSKLNAIDPKQNIEIEVYSCKQTRMQKKHYSIQKPLRYYISALEETFSDYDFSKTSINAFQKTTYQSILNELSFVFFTVYRNNDDVNQTLEFIDTIMNQCVNLRTSRFYVIDDLFNNEIEKCKVFLIHDTKLRRVVVIKSVTQT